MSCSENDLAELWLDGELAPVEAKAFEVHLETCEDCRQELASLRRLLAAARKLPMELEPGRDLWPSIEKTLPRPARRRRGWLRPGFLAVAATGVAAVALAFLLDGGRTSQAPEVSQAPAAAPVIPGLARAAGGGSGAPVDVLETAFEATRRQLLLELERQGGAEPTEAQKVVQRNLETIAAAIDEIRAALQEEPSSRRLQRQLLASYERQVELLALASRLSQS